MGECLRKACPCLEALWQRIFKDKQAAPEGGEGGGEGGTSSRVGGGGEQGSPSPASLPDGPADSGAMYAALWPFESRHPEEMSFQEGELFNVITRNGGWWSARKIDKNGRVLGTGIVPSNYLVRAESLEMEP